MDQNGLKYDKLYMHISLAEKLITSIFQQLATVVRVHISFVHQISSKLNGDVALRRQFDKHIQFNYLQFRGETF